MRLLVTTRSGLWLNTVISANSVTWKRKTHLPITNHIYVGYPIMFYFTYIVGEWWWIQPQVLYSLSIVLLVGAFVLHIIIWEPIKNSMVWSTEHLSDKAFMAEAHWVCGAQINKSLAAVYLSSCLPYNVTSFSS